MRFWLGIATVVVTERAIEKRGIGRAFEPDDREARRHWAWGTLEISLEQLSANERARFAELAPEPLPGDWADVLRRAGAAQESSARIGRFDALQGRQLTLQFDG